MREDVPISQVVETVSHRRGNRTKYGLVASFNIHKYKKKHSQVIHGDLPWSEVHVNPAKVDREMKSLSENE